MNNKNICPRLIDYLVVVGCQNPNRAHITNKNPEILRRYPSVDHKDFPLPTDVVYFCQPDGSLNTTIPEFFSDNYERPSESSRSSNSFLFTLTDKDSSKTRFGVCLNFIRPIYRRRKRPDENKLPSRRETLVNQSIQSTSSNSSTDLYANNVAQLKKRPKTHSLTSLCILSHHPFFTKFRNCLSVLLSLLQNVHENFRNENTELTIWSLLAGLGSNNDFQSLSESFKEIEIWIYKLISLPVPIPGKTLLNVKIQPDEVITFALPDHQRLSLVDFYLHLPFQLLGIEKALEVLTLLIMERKVLIVSKSYCNLTVTILSLTTLLYPLQYMFPVIPLLPTSLPNGKQILNAPSPFVIGVPDSFMNTNFHIANDIIIVNLDRAEILIRNQFVIPKIPNDEMTLLKDHIMNALDDLTPISDSMSVQSVVNSRTQTPSEFSHSSELNWAIQSCDEESINTSTRVKMIGFFDSMNILGKFSDYTRNLRLYPRPVVIIQHEAFLKSRQFKSRFLKELIKTQAVEYLAEWLYLPDNLAFNRILTGVKSPSDIGDHYKWFEEQVKKIECSIWHETDEDCGVKCSILGLDDKFDRISRKAYIGKRQINVQLSDPIKRDAAEEDIPTDESGSDTEPDQSTTSDFSTTSEFACEIPIKVEVEISPTPKTPTIEKVDTKYYFKNETLVSDMKGLPVHLRRLSSEHIKNVQPIKSSDNAKYSKESKTDLSPADVPQLRKQSFLRKSMENMFSVPKRQSNVAQSFEAPAYASRPHSIYALKDSANSINQNNNSLSNILDSQEGLEEVRNEYEDRCFMDTVLKEVEAGNTLTIFSGKNRFKNLMEMEANRNYVMSKVDRNLSTRPFTNENNFVNNHDIGSWSRYKALEWLLGILMQGIGNSFYSKKYESDSDLTWLTKGFSQNGTFLKRNISFGGLASAYIVFEVAYTYYVLLPRKKSKGIPTPNLTPSVTPSRLTEIERTHSEDPNKMKLASLESMSINGEDYEVIDVSSSASNMYTSDSDKRSRKLDSKSNSIDYVEIQDVGCFPHRKSNLSNGYRYCNGNLIRTDPTLGQTGIIEKPSMSNSYSRYSQSSSPVSTLSSRKTRAENAEAFQVYWTYLFEDLILKSNNSELFKNVQFWEDIFIDAVSQERDILGLDQNPRDLFDHYESLSSVEKKTLELKEDRVLASIMHNIIGFMNMVGLPKEEIRKKVRRFIAKSHTGLHYSQEINNLLDCLEFLNGNDIDLKPMLSRNLLNESYKVRKKNNSYREDCFLELADDCLLLRNIYGTIIDRWWYNRLTYITYKYPYLCLSRIVKDCTDMVTFHAQDRNLFIKIKEAIDNNRRKTSTEPFGISFGEKINIVDIETNQQGTICVNPRGFDFTFKDDNFTIPLIRIDSCLISEERIFIMKALHPLTKKIMTKKYETDFALILLNQWHKTLNYVMVRKNPFRSVTSNPHNSCTHTPQKKIVFKRTQSQLRML